MLKPLTLVVFLLSMCVGRHPAPLQTHAERPAAHALDVAFDAQKNDDSGPDENDSHNSRHLFDPCCVQSDARKSTVNRVEQVLDTAGLMGVASVRVESTTFIGVWTQTPRDQTLEIYSMRKYPTVRLIDEFKDSEVPFQSLTAIQDGAVAGFQIRRTTGEGWFGATIIYFYVAGHFQKVFESGNVAELHDLNGDGYPEALEYQGDKSASTCRVKISVWKDNQYKYLATVPIAQLYSPETRERIARFGNSAPR